MIRLISLEELGARRAVVASTIKGKGGKRITVIYFACGAFIRIIDKLNDHRVEAYAP